MPITLKFQNGNEVVASKDLRSLRAVGVAGLAHGELTQDILKNSFGPHVKKGDQVLSVGTIVRLVREPQNLFDPLAIRVDDEAGRKVGYVPNGQQKTLARLMDAGFPLYAAVLTHNVHTPIGSPERVMLAVYIEKYRPAPPVARRRR